MRAAHSPLVFWALTAFTPAFAHNHTLPPMLDPAAPSRPLVAPPLPASATIAEADTDWQATNAAVARFARGHADVVRWEKAQAAPAPQMPADAPPHHGHEHDHKHGHAMPVEGQP